MQNLFYLLASIFLILMMAWMFSRSGFDDSDKTRSERSGLMIFTDHKTGCQYVGTILGGITPRLTAQGTILCAPEEKKD